MQRTDASQVVTYTPALTQPVWLGQLGTVGGLQYSDSYPGGSDTMSCVLGCDPGFWHPAIGPGRCVRVFRGAVPQWEGTLSIPQPTSGGWALSASGAGHYGDNYRAIDTGGFVHADGAVSQAITRGLTWKKAASISDTGLWLSQPPSPGASTITDWLNLLCQNGTYGWHVDPFNMLTVAPLPALTAPTRLLVATSPAARTLAGYITALYAYYQATADNATTGATATYALGEADNTPGITAHGRIEALWDISSAGVLSSGTAIADAGSLLSRYQATSYASSFAVMPGQYLTMGGSPVDLGCEDAGEVVRLVLASGSDGGEFTGALACTFVVGGFEYNDDQGTAAVTPMQSIMSDLATLMSAASQAMTPATAPA